jgi:hypothetical protein
VDGNKSLGDWDQFANRNIFTYQASSVLAAAAVRDGTRGGGCIEVSDKLASQDIHHTNALNSAAHIEGGMKVVGSIVLPPPHRSPMVGEKWKGVDGTERARGLRRCRGKGPEEKENATGGKLCKME